MRTDTGKFLDNSKTVLGYINNDAQRFHVFVDNRVQEIREQTFPNYWHYVGTESNPADIASCVAGAQELIDDPLWWNGPDFLWNSRKDWNSVDDIPSIPPEDPEVKNVSVRATQEPRTTAILSIGAPDLFLQQALSIESDCRLSPISTKIPKDSS